MKTILLFAPFAISLLAAPARADPLNDILSIARSFGNSRGYVAQNRPVEPYSYRNDERARGLPYERNYTQSYAPSRSRSGALQRGSGQPLGEQLLELDYQQLRNVIHAANADFDRWLSGIPAGEYWRKYFQSRTVLETLAPDVNEPPTAEEREAIVSVLDGFDRAVSEPDLNDITRRTSAQTLRAALRELAALPEERLMRQLSQSARTLNRALGTFSTGVTWQRYLALPDAIVAAADRPPGTMEARPEIDAEELDEVLERYDRVSQSEEYDSIAALPEFQLTHQRLIEFVNPSATMPQRAALAEELPLPELRTR